MIMPKSDNQKLKILYILDYLQKNSHEDHPVRAADLITMLDRQQNIHCDRKTVYSDVAALIDYGVDIVTKPGKNGGYYSASRNFELPELKLLIDAVQSSRYLTEKKSRELIEKLCKECNVYDAGLMKRNVLVSGRVKSMNETIYYSVDAIQDAISQNRQICFRYFDWGMDGKLIKEQLVEAFEIKVEQADVLEMAKENTRMQFAQYGMMSIPEEMLENYAKEMLKKKENVEGLVNRAVETKLAAALKAKVSLNNKEVSMEEFNNLLK